MPRDPAHTIAAFDATYAEACRRWPPPDYDVEIEDRGPHNDHCGADGPPRRARRFRYVIRVWRYRHGTNGGRQRKQHAQGYGPTPALALAYCRTWRKHRQRARGQQAAL